MTDAEAFFAPVACPARHRPAGRSSAFACRRTRYRAKPQSTGRLDHQSQGRGYPRLHRSDQPAQRTDVHRRSASEGASQRGIQCHTVAERGVSAVPLGHGDARVQRADPGRCRPSSSECRGQGRSGQRAYRRRPIGNTGDPGAAHFRSRTDTPDPPACPAVRPSCCGVVGQCTDHQ